MIVDYHHWCINHCVIYIYIHIYIYNVATIVTVIKHSINHRYFTCFYNLYIILEAFSMPSSLEELLP